MAGEMRTSGNPPRTKIFVGRLPEDAQSEDLRKLFERYGIVVECDVLYRYGFVHMKTEEMAARAIEALNNTEFMGVRISVEQSTGKKGGRGFGDGGYRPMRMRGSMRGARTTPYMRQGPTYERRPGMPSFAREDYDYYPRSRGPPLYSRGDRLSTSDIHDKYDRSSFGRGCNPRDNMWMGPSSFDSSDDSGPQFSNSMYRR
ncbi:hypothetical protein R5R35_003986 [Gryllus longicercus]|uniref:RRM domain-containing protein n=1 Tax=Gryllus longicercus TaxID=2509291 RepID=A0AAN9VNA5_9ORTH